MAPSSPQVKLVPWDFTSPEHVERLIQQRIHCGWDSERVESWRPKQESGEFNLQWIVLSDDDPLKDDKVLKHTSEYPSESKLLQDTALSFGGKPRIIPLPQASFIPVGHICLGPTPAHYDDPKEPFAKGSYWISNFYVSRAVQSSGLGRAAMDTAERIATSEPLNARLLGLNAINKEDPDCEEKYKALNLPIPPFSNQDWYERRGYKLYMDIPKAFSKTDSTGKIWFWDAVCLKKTIV
ncbi:hypothetical protein IFR04_007229 [Cadophora malorum]|uniref:N-acetyltransferase domain-containing protein n=1 Tax=Cadophora malorum TaxID=108018 RepID=A0A8H7THC4_9HELO|nr:hypothetical protein IFR04_007229 [Cadophora malorum]